VAAKYRIGIIGRTGKGNYGHGLDRVWSDVLQTEVIAVADEHPGGRAAVAKKTGAKRTYADYRQMLEKEKLDIVAVAPRWIDQHRDMILAVAEHGCHIYMEKPFCRTLEEADEIVQSCEMRHLKLAIAHTNRYTPTRQVVRKLIADEVIGDILEIRARGKEDRRGGGEDLWVLGTHILDLMRTFAGDVKTCFAQVTLKGNPITKADLYDGNEGIGPLAGDGVEAVYSFKNGITGFFASHRGRMGRPSRFGIQIFGSKGILEMTSGFLKTAYLLKDPSWSPGRSGAKWIPVSTNGIGKSEKTAGNSNRGNLAAVEDLIEAIEKDRQPISNVYDARASTEMIVSVFESQRLGGPVSFPLKNRKNPLNMLKG
jgi:predicted dehydrogenase